MEWYKSQRIIIIIFIILSLITGSTTYTLYKAAHEMKTPTQEGSNTVDKATGLPIENDSGRTPETYNVNPSTPVLLGFEKMIDQGVTESDLTTFQTGITQYFISTKNYSPRSKVSLSNARCANPDNAGYVNCTYNLTVNDSVLLTGTLRTNLSGPVTISIKKDSKSVFELTQNAS